AAAKTVAAFATVGSRGGIAGRTYKVAGRPLKQPLPSWTLSGEGTHRDDKDTDFIQLDAAAPLAGDIDHLEFFMRWGAETFAGPTSAGFSEHSVFVTPRPAHDPGFPRYADTPHVPTS